MRPHAEVEADFEAGIPLDMDGERWHPRRTPEAQADIAAARAAPTAMEQAEAEHLEHDAAAERYQRLRSEMAAEAEREIPLDTALSNSALADTPAVREMGGGFVRVTDMPAKKCRLCSAPGGTDDPHVCIGQDAIVLTGPEAERYRALRAAARKAQESTAAARADGAALLQLFQAFCAGLAPGKDG